VSRLVPVGVNAAGLVSRIWNRQKVVRTSLRGLAV
jgi:hypothetical protein